MKEKGLVSNYEDYLNLPLQVLDDARMVIVGEAQREQRRQQPERMRRGNRR